MLHLHQGSGGRDKWWRKGRRPAEEGPPRVITPAQCLEARKLLGWSRDRLAPRCGMPAERLRLFEIGSRELSAKDRATLKRRLEAAGVEFTDGGDPG